MVAADKRASLLRPNVDVVADEKVLSSRRRQLIKVGQKQQDRRRWKWKLRRWSKLTRLNLFLGWRRRFRRNGGKVPFSCRHPKWGKRRFDKICLFKVARTWNFTHLHRWKQCREISNGERKRDRDRVRDSGLLKRGFGVFRKFDCGSNACSWNLARIQGKMMQGYKHQRETERARKNEERVRYRVLLKMSFGVTLKFDCQIPVVEILHFLYARLQVIK